MLKFVGEDRILFGSEAVYYGSPQWEIEAFWRFQIPEEIRKRWGYPALTERAKRKILGLNSARLYGLPTATEDEHEHEHGGLYTPVPANYESLIPAQLKTLLEFPGYTADNMSKMRQRYVELGGDRTNTRYGWIRTRTLLKHSRRGTRHVGPTDVAPAPRSGDDDGECGDDDGN